MNQEYIALKGIEFIIDNDPMNSTYKLALCKGATEISYTHAEKAFLSCDSKKIVFPLSYITAYFIRYYFPIFDSHSYIPQLNTESHKNNSSSQSAFRKDFTPIIDYYSGHGGFGILWDQMQKDTIPPQIKDGWNKLCHKINATIVNQPMKYFGRKNSNQIYSVFELVPDYLPDDYFEDFPGCSVNNDFFSYPLEYHDLFKNVSYSKYLIEKIHQRWCSFTMSLVDDESGISSKQVMNILIHSTNGEIVTQSEQKYHDASDRPPLQIIPIIQNLHSGEINENDSDILSYSAENVVDSLHKTVSESYTDLIFVKSEWNDAEIELSQIDSEIKKSKASIQKIMNQYGIVSSPVSAVIATLENEKSCVKSELNSNEQITKQRRNDLIHQIDGQKTEIKDLERIYDSLLFDHKEFAEKKAEVLQLNEEYETLERYLNGRPPAFGYIGKPIKRFLTHCDDIASKFLLQSINLYIEKNSPSSQTNTISDLPEWFISAFDNWWKDKQNTLHRERTAGGKISYNPVLLFDPGHCEITLMVPAQHIQSKRPLDEVVFTVHSSSEIIYEETHPLCHEGQGYVSEEFLLPLSVPSDTYYVEIVSKDSSKRFPPVAIFSPQKKYACFDYETGRLISGDNTILEKSAYVIYSEPVTIKPESAIIGSGRFYGPWQGYSYCLVEPEYSDSEHVVIGVADGTDDAINHTYPSIALENYHSLDKIRVNSKTTLSGPPPTILLFLPLPEDLSEYRLSIHPLCPGTLSETHVYSYDDFKEHCSLSEDGTACRFDLASDFYLGKRPIGTFAVRIRNQKKKFDHILEFSIIPELSVSFSKHLYTPKKGKEIVALRLGGPTQLQCRVDEPFVAEIENHSWFISGPLMQDVNGTLSLAIPGEISFSGTFSLPISHLSWRFENPEKEIICPIQRNVITVSDDAYDELGDGKTLTIFLPEEYSGTGTITITPGKSYIMHNIRKGKAIFSLSRFNDILRETHALNYSFAFSFESQKEHFDTHLFDLDIWEISGFTWDVATDGDTREITFNWQEEGDVPGRKMIVWRAGLKDGSPQKKAELVIPAGAKTLTMSDARNKVPPGVYYAQFIRTRDEWSSPSVMFPGEHTPNFFQFSVELEGSDLLKEGDDLLAAGQYIEAIERYRELEQLNTQLDGLWKQKIQNTFMYTFRYDEALNLFDELLRNTSFLKQTDYSYITFRVFECLKKPEKMTYNTFIRLLVVLDQLVNINDKTSVQIILNHLPDFTKAMKSCRVLEEDQIVYIQKMIQDVRYCMNNQ